MLDLEGKRAEVEFETGYHFTVEYLPNQQLRWTSLRKEDSGRSETETIYFDKVDDGKYNINWIEKSGISVTHNIDINQGIIWAFMSWPNEGKYGNREVLTHKGTFKFIDSDGKEDTTPFTNLQKATDFWNRFFNQHDASAVDDYLAAPYIQHNPAVPDGVKPFRDFFVHAFEHEMKDRQSKIMTAASAGDKVYIHNLIKLNPEDRGTVGMDIFRFDNGKIVEHWDIHQPFPEKAANDHPMF